MRDTFPESEFPRQPKGVDFSRLVELEIETPQTDTLPPQTIDITKLVPLLSVLHGEFNVVARAGREVPPGRQEGNRIPNPPIKVRQGGSQVRGRPSKQNAGRQQRPRRAE